LSAVARSSARARPVVHEVLTALVAAATSYAPAPPG
jgi:hypothetical protein